MEGTSHPSCAWWPREGLCCGAGHGRWKGVRDVVAGVVAHSGGVPSFTQSPLPMLWGGWGSERHGEDSWTPTAMWEHGICVPRSPHPWGTGRGEGHPAVGLEQRALPWGYGGQIWSRAGGTQRPAGLWLQKAASQAHPCIRIPTGSPSASSCCRGQNHLDHKSGRLGRSRPLASNS